jgi:hypothetical protein
MAVPAPGGVGVGAALDTVTVSTMLQDALCEVQ